MRELLLVGNWQGEKKKEKERVKKEIKIVSTLDIQIKQSGLKVSSSEVFSSDQTNLIIINNNINNNNNNNKQNDFNKTEYKYIFLRKLFSILE